jgi:hypothetical protein
MPFVAGSITVGELVIQAPVQAAPRNGTGSFEALRDKLYGQLLNQELPHLPSKKIREVDSKLIQYKESAFLSDMLSSSKD